MFDRATQTWAVPGVSDRNVIADARDWTGAVQSCQEMMEPSRSWRRDALIADPSTVVAIFIRPSDLFRTV